MVRMLFGFGSQTPPHSIGSAPFSKCLPLPILHPGFWQGWGMSTREEGKSAILCSLCTEMWQLWEIQVPLLALLGGSSSL